MNTIVPRTCTEISPPDENRNQQKDSRPLKAFRDRPAYVLLGDPGSGKTTSFRREATRQGGFYVSARDFITFEDRPEWRDKTLFIDGLDEVRAQRDAITPFDEIRRRLDALGRPRFRLSCRVADWLGTNDRKHLASVSPDSAVTVLRLDLLTKSDIVRILTSMDIGDARAFIAAARKRSVDGLLANPQSLKMLADVVARDGEWPESRLETFEKACLQLVREHNEEHEIATRSDPKKLLNAAGRLCAVQLISGTAGYTLDHGQPDEDYPALSQCDYDSPDALRSALSTKLFKGETNNRFTPIHRHIAEFLGARHLAQCIDEGLPAQRILDLITGEDEIVVTEMRGLSAWLAAHCKNARADLIERDPIGVGLYGDIRGFSSDEKRALLKALNREASRLGSVFPAAAAFGPLATPDMEPALRDVLNDSSRGKEHQLFAGFVLRLLREGTPLPGLSRILLDIVRDDTWSPGINTLALDAFIHNCHNSQEKTSELKALLADIQNGSVSDPDDELLGALLYHLYPRELSPTEVWNYQSSTSNRRSFFGMYWLFWRTGLSQKSSDAQVAELLDSLPKSNRRPKHFPIILLARDLKARGDQLDTGRLYDWLDMGLAGNDDEEAIGDIRSWLEQRPEVQKKIIAEGLKRCPQSDEFRYHAFNVQKRLYGASLPPDFGRWCLKQAVAMADTKPRVAEHLLELAWRSHTDRSGNEGLSFELLEEHSQKNEALKAHLAQLRTPPPDYGLENRGRRRDRYIDQRRRQEEQWLDHVRSNEAALRQNRAAPDLLYQMAKQYFGNFYNFNDDGPKAIEKRLRGDRGLVDATLQGLRGTIDREDVPDIDEILALREKSRMHYLGWPFLAGLAEVERTAPEDPSGWDDGRIRKAVAFYYCTAHGGYRPKWYRRLLEARPEIVADVQVQFAVSEFRGDRESIYKLWELAHDPHHAQVAQHASLPLLRAFPIRCKLKHIKALDHLLWAALQHADRALFQELIERKLSRTSMNVAQRVHWLAAGVIVSRTTFEDCLKDFVWGREDRIRHLAAFFCPDDRVRFSFDELGIPGLELLIRLVGSYVGPDQAWSDGADGDEGGWVGPEMQAAWLVHELIRNLAVSPDRGASDALELLDDKALSRWQDVLSQARDSQSVIRRDAGYRHPDIEQVCQTLNGGSPANAGDLAALVRDRLCEIADQIRTGNTDDWRQYWNEDRNGRPCKPKPENSCRDALLSDLRQRLPQGVDAQPEGQYARDKRADIRVSCQNFQVPVEVKKNSHRELWSALQKQLIAQYTSDPATDGHGIYLVFWFGKDCAQPPPSGTRPESPQDLEKQLKATLSEDEAHKISVCVIDVSGDLLDYLEK